MGPKHTNRTKTLRYVSLMLESNESDVLMHAERPLPNLLVQQRLVLVGEDIKPSNGGSYFEKMVGSL